LAHELLYIPAFVKQKHIHPHSKKTPIAGRPSNCFTVMGLALNGCALVLLAALVFLPAREASAHALPKSCLAALNSEVQSGKTYDSLIKSKDGQQLHQELIELISLDHNFWALMDEHLNQGKTFKNILNKIDSDHRRIIKGLNVLAQRYRSEPYAGMIQHTLAATHREQETSVHNHLYHFNLNQLWNSPSTRDLVGEVIFKQWGRNRSFIAELLTALETSGLFAIGIRIEDIIPLKNREHFQKHFRNINRLSLLRTEIDIVAHNEDHTGYVWLEVKNPLRTCSDMAQCTPDRALKTKSNVDEFFAIVLANPDLKSRFHVENIRFELVVRGAGITPELQAQLKQQAGVVAHDRRLIPAAN